MLRPLPTALRHVKERVMIDVFTILRRHENVWIQGLFVERGEKGERGTEFVMHIGSGDLEHKVIGGDGDMPP